MKLKAFATTALMCTSLLALPTLAQADNVNISNDTAYSVSFSVNGVCSPEFGTVHRYSLKTVAESDFRKACRYAIDPCQVVIHSAKHCYGTTFATINYYIDRNFVEAFGHNVPRIGVGVSGYNIFLVQAMDGKKSN